MTITLAHLFAFVCISCIAHRIGEWWNKKHGADVHESHHATIYGMVGSDPSVWHGVQEFFTHLVVYSGHVIPLH